MYDWDYLDYSIKMTVGTPIQYLMLKLDIYNQVLFYLNHKILQYSWVALTNYSY